MREAAPLHIEVLLSTMMMKDHQVVDSLNLKCDCLIVNQDGYAMQELLVRGDNRVRILHVGERGLSKSRNLALENASGDICLFADDDMSYKDDYIKTVQEAYRNIGDADIIVFGFHSDVTWRSKKNGSKVRRLGYLDCLRVSSVMISFRRKSIVDAGIRFNELFGAGSEFPSGEENIFLFDCLRKGLKIYYYPAIIATVTFAGSTWLDGFNAKYFRAKGALGYMLFKKFYFLFILQFAVRKYGLYRRHMGLGAAIRHMLGGQRYCAALIDNSHAKS